jgi:allantoin racemase
MAHKLMILNPWGVDYCDDAALDVMGSALRDDVDLECVNLGDGSAPVPYPVPEGRDAAVRASVRAEAEGFDAILIACAGDPFLDEIREAVAVPVIGVAESVIIGAHSRGKLGVLRRRLPSDPWDSVWRDESLTRNWLNRDDPQALGNIMFAAFEESLLADGVVQTNAAAAEDGVDAVFFACNFWSPAIAALGVDAGKFDVPLINPLVSAATYAQHLLDSAT